MKFALALLGVLFVLGGTFFGVVNWFLTEFYLERVNWEGPMLVVNQAIWILNILGFGLGGILIGIAAMLRDPAQ